MTYLDSSVVLRHVLGQPDPLPLAAQGPCVASQLLEVECLRTLDRGRLVRGWSESNLRSRREALQTVLHSIHIVPLDTAVLVRASAPLPFPLGTLDAFHLATALLLLEDGEPEVRIATHDRALADAARAHGLEVVGV